MVNVTLISQRLREVHFTNRIEQSGKFPLENGFNFHVDYTSDNSRCVATLYQSAKMKEDPEKLFLSGEIVGVFRLEGVVTESDRQHAHVQCYQQLFPFLQSAIANLAACSGMPGFLIQKKNIKPQDIIFTPKGN